MKTRFSYFRDPKGTIRVVVCDLYNERHWSRGVALASFDDSPNAKEGRIRAMGRALRAIERQKATGRPIQSPRALHILAICNAPHLANAPKSSWCPGEVDWDEDEMSRIAETSSQSASSEMAAMQMSPK
jgi:hypothetical protein